MAELLAQIETVLERMIPKELQAILPPHFQGNLAIVALVAGALLVLLTTVLLRASSGGKKEGRTVLFIGTCGAGKTAMWKKLEGGPLPEGYLTSMQENISSGPLSPSSSKVVRWVDFPGHARLRSRLPEFLDSASAIVFVIDSLEFPSQYQEVAELMMDVLTHRAVQKRSLPILVACNKQDDSVKAYSVDFVRKKLEKQLDSLQSSRGALGESGKKGGSGVQLLPGKKGEPFTFAQWPGKLEVLATSVPEGNGAPGLDGVRAFLAKNL